MHVIQLVVWVCAEVLSLACVGYPEGFLLQEATVGPLHAAVCAGVGQGGVPDSLGEVAVY